MKFDLRTVSHEDSLRLQDRGDVVDDRSVMRHVVQCLERNDGVKERAGSQLRRETHLRVADDRRDATHTGVRDLPRVHIHAAHVVARPN